MISNSSRNSGYMSDTNYNLSNRKYENYYRDFSTDLYNRTYTGTNKPFVDFIKPMYHPPEPRKPYTMGSPLYQYSMVSSSQSSLNDQLSETASQSTQNSSNYRTYNDYMNKMPNPSQNQMH